MSPTALDIRNVSHWYGPKRILHNINLQIGAGQIVAVAGRADVVRALCCELSWERILRRPARSSPTAMQSPSRLAT